MRILVYPHSLQLGGSQINAVELAATVRDLGHEVCVYGHDGPLIRQVHDLGLEFIPAPRARVRPTPAIVTSLCRTIKQRAIDVVHAYEWPPLFEARLASMLTRRSACVGTVMSMSVAPFIPHHLPLGVGTRQIADTETSAGRQRVFVIEPPVDIDRNRPDIDLATDAFRACHGLDQDARTVVIVGRLARELKLEGLLCAIEVVPQLERDVQLVIVGDGPACHEVALAAEQANLRAGRRAVILTGQIEDPRPAYAIADVVLGMGSSALRAMAFAKTVIIQGERGFWAPVTEASASRFLRDGWFGLGQGVEFGPPTLRQHLTEALSSRALRERRGSWARQLVVERFSLEQAARAQVKAYEATVSDKGTRLRNARSDASALAKFLPYALEREFRGRFGALPDDDFNAIPLVGGDLPEPVGIARD